MFDNVKKQINIRTKLAITLRWLAGGSYLDICFAFGISQGTFFKNEGVLSEIVLSPYSGRGIGIWRDFFNYHLSSIKYASNY